MGNIEIKKDLDVLACRALNANVQVQEAVRRANDMLAFNMGFEH